MQLKTNKETFTLTKYDYLIVTHIPSFYKVNLYNELSKTLKILVVFLADDTREKRSEDFITLERSDFEYKVLYKGLLEKRKWFRNLGQLRSIVKKDNYARIVVSGWDQMEYWYLVFISSKSKNFLALESTINESTSYGLKGVFKKKFLKRISEVFASGILHKDLLDALNYRGRIVITKGVGIINKPGYKKSKKEYSGKFLFIGRLSKEKNINLLIQIFNQLPRHTLTILGTGPLQSDLRHKVKPNIKLLGSIPNAELKNYFLDNDILILPSENEPWGIVVEEALYFGLPVVITKNCGASLLIKDGLNGFVVDSQIESIKNSILSISQENYRLLSDGVKKISIAEKDEEQVLVYKSIVKDVQQNADNPLVSVVTVVLNGEKELERTVQSVINQTYSNLEYIVIDGGSTDNTLEIIKQYEDTISCWISEKDRGIYDAMNKGIDLANGEWINFMNVGDTFFNANTLEELFTKYRFNEMDILYGDHEVRYPHKTKIKRAKRIKGFWKGSRFCHQSSFVSSKLHKANKFNILNPIGADFELFYKAYKKNKKFQFLNSVVSSISSGGVSDVRRVDSIVSWWNVAQKNYRVNIYYSISIIKQMVKTLTKKILRV